MNDSRWADSKPLDTRPLDAELVADDRKPADNSGLFAKVEIFRMP